MSKKVKHEGKILYSDDKYFSTDGYSKKRRVLITEDNKDIIGVNKIYSKNNKKKRYRKSLKPNDALTKPSELDSKTYYYNEKNNEKLKITDDIFIDSKVKITSKELKEIKNWLRKQRKKK